MFWLFIYFLLSVIIGVISLKQGKKHLGEEDYDMCTGEHWIVDKEIIVDDSVISAIFSPLVFAMIISLLPIKLVEFILNKIYDKIE